MELSVRNAEEQSSEEFRVNNVYYEPCVFSKEKTQAALSEKSKDFLDNDPPLTPYRVILSNC